VNPFQVMEKHELYLNIKLPIEK